jgi:hypothetical protein
LRAIRQDGELLWIMVTVADPQWEEAVIRTGERTFDITDYNNYHDTMIEVIDLSRNQVVVTKRFDESFMGFVGNGLVYGTTQDSVGTPSVPIWRLDLTTTPQTGGSK